MKLEEQVSSLELSKKLKSLGVKQESAFYWMEWLKSNDGDWKNRVPSGEWSVRFKDGSDPRYWDFDNKIAAFTVAELGEMLPKFIELRRGVGATLRIEPLPSKEWRLQYQRKFDEGAYTDDRIPTNPICSDTEANARAKCLIHLIENGIVKP